MKNIIWLSDYIELSRAAADIVQNTITQHSRVNLGCPTGFTPIGMYHQLVSRNLDWEHVSIFNLDEYCDLPENHPGSYRHYMWTHLHKHVVVNSSYFPNAHYDKTIELHGGLHLTILGLGYNGHIAFNEPNSSIDSVTRRVQLSADTIARNSAGWDHEIAFPTHAHTMGIKTILQSRSILLLVCGAAKRDMLTRALWGTQSSTCPASYLQTHNNLTVLYCE